MEYQKRDQLKNSKKKSQTQINRQQRKKIAKLCKENSWTRCRFMLPGCSGEANDPVHRHERNWYKGKDPALLSNTKQWLPGCRNCHHTLDNIMTKAEREEIFKKLVG